MTQADDESKLVLQLKLDHVCIEFERKLRSGEEPRIEELLSLEEDAVRPKLLEHLLTVEWEFRRASTDPLLIDSAVARFPEYEGVVQRVFKHLALPDQIAETQPHRSGDSTPSSSSIHGRFEPGQRVSGRYRIVSLVGKGGMGEVYRADDLILGQAVALKFLPEDFTNDSKRLDYFFAEVRLARQVSHPNVCRVHDIGEVGGLHFISMEFIDGEDLKTLLERIGRLGNDKGLEIAQQLCLGLAAAHERGVLHRDLKPANVMIDGRGQVRITDFGLATLADDERSQQSFVGTPAYMAPEQLLGGEASVRGDIYSLGLVLYELFTAKKAREHRSASVGDSGSSINKPSEFADDIDPNVQELIGHCLQEEPQRRPGSALELFQLLPNSDPIAAALAAGQTPSPATVASAGGTGAISLWSGLLLVALTLIGLTGIVILNGVTPEHFKKQPVVLREVAESILEHAGLQRHRFTAHGFRFDEDLVADKSVGDRHAEEYWYRSSPQRLVPHGTISLGRAHSRIRTLHNPPPLLERMISMRLSGDGRLRELLFIPEQDLPSSEDTEGAVSSETWAQLFSDAGHDFADFQPTEPKWRPPFAARPHAWSKSSPANPNESVRVEAGTDRGRVIYFQPIWPKGPGETTAMWTLDRTDGRGTWSWQALPYRTMLGETAETLFVAGSMWYALMILSFFVALKQYRTGNCNVRGSIQLFFVVLVVNVLVALLEGDHAADFRDEIMLFDHAVLRGLVRAFGIGLMYGAIEPLIRAHLPHTMISWNRLLNGRLDAMVARDALIGCALATWMALIPCYLDPGHGFSPIAMMGARQAFAQIPAALIWGLMISLFSLSVILLLTMTTRRLWIGCVVFLVLMLAQMLAPGRIAEIPVMGAATISVLFLLVRFGLVACLAFEVCVYVIGRIPITHDMDRWYANAGVFGVMLIFVCTVALCYRAVTGSHKPSEVV